MPSELIVVIVDVVALELVSSALELLAKEEVVMEAVMLLVVIFPILTYIGRDITSHAIQANSNEWSLQLPHVLHNQTKENSSSALEAREVCCPWLKANLPTHSYHLMLQ